MNHLSYLDKSLESDGVSGCEWLLERHLSLRMADVYLFGHWVNGSKKSTKWMSLDLVYVVRLCQIRSRVTANSVQANV